MSVEEVIKRLKSLANPQNIAGMVRFGINPKDTWGIPIPELRKLAKEIGKDHTLALGLWQSGIHEARILASMTDEVEKVTAKQMDAWVTDFDSWDVCDQVCLNLFDKTPFAWEKAKEWVGASSFAKPAGRQGRASEGKEFVRRAGFALMACLAWHDKQADHRKFLVFFPLIDKYATDERNFVKKAVNWALRQIGKRNELLKKEAIKLSQKLVKIDNKTSRWVGGDALRELTRHNV